MSSQGPKGTPNQEVANGVLAKLIAFSLALGIVPISSYFGSLNYIWHGNATFAAITAVFAANVVLVGYIITSLQEERKAGVNETSSRPTETQKEK